MEAAAPTRDSSSDTTNTQETVDEAQNTKNARGGSSGKIFDEENKSKSLSIYVIHRYTKYCPINGKLLISTLD